MSGHQELFTLGESDDAASIVRGMLQYKLHSKLLAAGCKTLSLLICKNIQNQAEILKSGGIECVVRAMEDYGKDRQLQLHACGTLVDLACNNKDTKERITAAGGLDRIIAAMTTFAGDSEVQLQACRALCNMAHNADANRFKIAALGGIDRIIEAMRNYKAHQQLQLFALKSLVNLADSCADNKVKIAGAGGIECIIEAMENHTEVTDVDLQLQACGALRNLICKTQKRDTRDEIVTKGGAEQIVRAMTRHKCHKQLQSTAIGTLSNLAHKHEACQGKLVNAGTLDLKFCPQPHPHLSASKRQRADLSHVCSDLSDVRGVCRRDQARHRRHGALRGRR